MRSLSDGFVGKYDTCCLGESVVAVGPPSGLSHVGNPYSRRAFQRGAVGVQRRPVHHGVTDAARPGGVSAAFAQAGLMADQDLVRAEGVPVGAARWWVGDPLPVCCLNSSPSTSQG